jgi:hypothetical protein
MEDVCHEQAPDHPAHQQAREEAERDEARRLLDEIIARRR